MLDLGLIALLGFLGSFGHCVGMCGPLTIAFSLSHREETGGKWRSLWFHGLLNLGRLLSYALVGAGIGALGSVVFAGGQMAGVGSDVRRAVAIFSGLALIWVGLVQLNPALLPRIPLLNPMAQGRWHNRLGTAMSRLAMQTNLWTPLLLGMTWGLMPCGFLYAAQIKAADSGNLLMGSATMLAFGLGTLPTMTGVGLLMERMSGDRRSQLFRLGGWVTLIIGILTLTRTGDMMVDVTGHGAIVLLIVALLARPLRSLWAAPLRYRRAIGVGSFILAVAHTVHMLEHTWNWNPQAIAFMLPSHQLGMVAGGLGLALMAPAAFTSFDQAQQSLGYLWRRIHLLTVPALLLCALHCTLVGTHYLGRLQLTWTNYTCTTLLAIAVVGVLAVRSWRNDPSKRLPSQSFSVSANPSTHAADSQTHDHASFSGQTRPPNAHADGQSPASARAANDCCSSSPDCQ